LLSFAGCGFAGGPWTVGVVLVALASAAYQPAFYAVLPAASHDSCIPLPRVSGWMEAGRNSAILVGVLLGWSLRGEDVTTLTTAAILTLLAVNGVSLLAALPATFPSDRSRTEPAGAALRGFWIDLGRVLRHKPARGFLLGISALQAIVTAGGGALLA